MSVINNKQDSHLSNISLNDFEINVEKRVDFGSAKAAKNRYENKIPAGFYGKINGENVVLHGLMDLFELNRFLASKTLFNKFTKINFDNKTYYAFAKVLQRDSLTDKILNIDFILVDLQSDKKIKMVVPIVFVDVELCEEIKLGGVLNKVLERLPLVAAPKNMPSYIQYSVKNATSKKSITLKDLDLGQGVIVSSKNKENTVATILVGRKKVAATTDVVA